MEEADLARVRMGNVRTVGSPARNRGVMREARDHRLKPVILLFAERSRSIRSDATRARWSRPAASRPGPSRRGR
jgi:hypothetical protein